MDHLEATPSTLADLASLVGEEVLVIHGPAGIGSELSGTDVDCVVQGLDPTWPLRLTGDRRLCNSIQYDLRSWYWIVEQDGEVIALDTVDDPKGLGRDSFRSSLFFGEHGTASAPLLAAYLTSKRLRKSITAEREWDRIGTLARIDPVRFRLLLQTILGDQLARMVSEHALDGRVPDPEVFKASTRLRRFHRLGTPERFASALILGARRYAGRILSPNGLSILIGGPDGSGKSTLAEALPGACEGIFRRYARFHWRPGLLPRAGAFLGAERADPSKPHAAPPRARGVSLAVLGYYWMDFGLGALTRILPLRVRAGMAVVERGWWDMVVDPTRYRLNVSERIVRVMGALIPQYDLALILDASPEVLLTRKGELPAEESRRQAAVWRDVLPDRVPRVFIDTAHPQAHVLKQAREEILEAMEARTVARLAAGWATIPNSSRPRWWIPRGPASTADTALTIYQPMTPRGRVAWEAARVLAARGGFRVLPRGDAPPKEVRRALAPHMPARCTVAVMRANHPGRYTALIVDDRGRRRALAKVATDTAGADALEREAASIRSIGARLPPPLIAPRILAEERGLLLLEAIAWRVRAHPWLLGTEVAGALGAFFRSGALDSAAGQRGLAHGDFAPWNILQADRAVALIDWESAGDQLPAFHDPCHFLVQSHALLGHPSSYQLLRGVRRGEGWVGAAIGSYSEGAHVSSKDATDALRSYLCLTSPMLRPRSNHERAGVLARERLLKALAS